MLCELSSVLFIGKNSSERMLVLYCRLGKKTKNPMTFPTFSPTEGVAWPWLREQQLWPRGDAVCGSVRGAGC